MIEPLVIAVVLNYNQDQDTLDCLASLKKNNYKNLRVIVLECGSRNSYYIEGLRGLFADIEIIELSENLGYAGNNNIGILAALERGAEWVFILNNDTLLDPTCLATLVTSGKADPEIGIVGPLVYHHDEPQIIQSAGGILGKYWESIHLGKDELDQGQFNVPKRVDWVSGCALLVRRTVIEQVGMLDEDYFLYWEETEWCIRAARGGWQIIHDPLAKIWHKGVQRNYQPRVSFTYYATRNHLLTLKKHNAPIQVKVYTWMQLWRTLISWSIKPKWRDKRGHRNAMWRGMLDFIHGRWGPMPS